MTEEESKTRLREVFERCKRSRKIENIHKAVGLCLICLDRAEYSSNLRTELEVLKMNTAPTFVYMGENGPVEVDWEAEI